MKKFVLLLASFAISNSVIAAQFECENSGRITYQDESCNSSQCMNLEQPTNLIRLFDKVSVSPLRVNKGKTSKDSTELLMEVDAINDSPNKVKLTIKYDGLDKNGFIVANESVYGTIESNSRIRINNGSIFVFKKTELLNRIVQWKFSSWTATLN
ncbi:MAG: hypothetical protein PHC99_08150 [Methylococcales bacterium]|nr:hypothetical protein [Methylococcales bacterium]